MNSAPSPDDSLLRALLDEAAPADFRAATLAATLRGARRRRILRRARATTAALALPLLAAALLFLVPRRAAPTLATHPAPARPVPTTAVAGCEIIRTRPAPELHVATRPLATSQLLASAPLERAARVRTDPRFGPLLIDDAELLALAPRASALIRLAPGRQRLVLPDSNPSPGP